MKIAVLSGKGGTGKTFVSVNLAALETNADYIDCDVEEPNGKLFFKSEIKETRPVRIRIPQVDDKLCIGCKKCVSFCRYSALAYGRKLMVFDELCHSCGGCSLVCPTKAIKEIDKEIGILERYKYGGINVATGELYVGEASGMPIIKELLSGVKDKSKCSFVDCPPGSGCAVVMCVKEADFCLAVAEPTIFGTHNLEIIYNLIKQVNKPFGVVLNKTIEDSYNPAEIFCQNNGIIILGKIPYSGEIGLLNSNGEIVADKNKSIKSIFSSILSNLKKELTA